jgi:hypothetical protein
MTGKKNTPKLWVVSTPETMGQEINRRTVSSSVATEFAVRHQLSAEYKRPGAVPGRVQSRGGYFDD